MPYSVTLGMPLFVYQLNRTTPVLEGHWVGTVATLYKNVKKKGVQFFRNQRYNFFKIENGGWLFTWMGGKDKVRQKLLSVVEGREKEEVDKLSDEEIESRIPLSHAIPIDSPYPNDFPKYILDNMDYFKSIGFIAE